MEHPGDVYCRLVDNLPDGFARLQVVTDAEGAPVDFVFMEVNPAFEAMTGLFRDRVIGHNATEVLPGIERSAFDWIGTLGTVALSGQNLCVEQFAEPLRAWYEVTAFRDQPGQVIAVFHDITEHKRRESTLADELIRRRILVEQSRDGIVVLDQDGKAVEANLRFTEMLGYSPQEVLELHVWDWDIPHPEGALKEMVRTVDESGDHFETQHRRKDGSLYDVEISTNAATFGEKKLVFCVCRDITERKRVQKALEQSEERLSQLARQSRAIAWEGDVDGLFTYISPVVEDMLHYKPEQLVGRRHFFDLMPETIRKDSMEQFLGIIQRGEAIADVEAPVIDKNGRQVWLSISGLPLQGDDSGPAAYRGWGIDITVRKEAEMILQESEERFRSLFEHSINAIYIGTPDGEVIDVNDAWLELLGYSREDLLGLNASAFYADPAERASFMQRMAETGSVRDEVRLRRKDGSVFDCQRVQVARRDEGGNVVAYQGILRDITQQKRDRAELERLARFDTLTGVLNRHSILERFNNWLQQAQRYRGSLSVVMVDIDHFKQVNDIHGHQVGDQVLAATAGLLLRSARETDFVGRYGGEEFLLILPHTDSPGAAAVSERARRDIQNTGMHDRNGDTFTITASFGVAEWVERDDDNRLVSRADAALYRAKAAGRNRVEVAPHEGAPERTREQPASG